MLSKKCRVNASDVESMALTLSNVSKTLADLKGIVARLKLTYKSSILLTRGASHIYSA